MKRLAVTLGVTLAVTPCLADPAIHYAPAENLEHIL